MAQQASQHEKGANGAPESQPNMKPCWKDHFLKPVARMASKWAGAVSLATLEPVMLLDGACYQAMLVIMENVQMEKVCSLKLNLSMEVCQNLSAYEEETIDVQQKFTSFAFTNSILMSIFPAYVSIFLGAWSDKYGRKIPLMISLIAHLANAAGYLLNHYMKLWPMELLYVVTFLDSLGGGPASFLMMGACYSSDLSSSWSHTSHVSTNNSFWFLGGPLGTLICGLLIRKGNFAVPLILVLMTYTFSVFYVYYFVKETHGPFTHESLRRPEEQNEVRLTRAEVSKKEMLKDFFELKRVREVYDTVLKKRDGNGRFIIIVVVISNMLRRIAKGFYMYMFVRRALLWEADDYSYWITYRNLITALGSLFLVPTLSQWLNFSDLSLLLLGVISLVFEYLSYGFVNTHMVFLMWLGPLLGFLSNTIVITLRSSATKVVRKEEKGHISAVLASTNGLIPLMSSGVYYVVYHHTLHTFPSAQFFFGAGLSGLIFIAYLALRFKAPPAKSDVNAESGKVDASSPPTKKNSAALEDENQNEGYVNISCIVESDNCTERGANERGLGVVAKSSVMLYLNEEESCHAVERGWLSKKPGGITSPTP